MYIYPDSDLYILKNVNLNNDYDHTIYFTNITDQTNFFLSKYKYHLTNQSYMRKERGWMNVDINQNDLFDCTYLMFKNTHYTGRWFYAFILSVDYVNDKTSKINFEIDVMQTWHFDYILDECFVEREHSETDELFENLVDENLDLGDDYNVQIIDNFDLTPSTVVVLSADNFNESPEEDYKRNLFIHGYYYPIKVKMYDLRSSTERNRLSSFIDLIVQEGQEDAIIQIYQVPSFINFPIFDDDLNYKTTTSKIFTPNFVNIDGYVPRNKKLFSYPYNFLSISNREGNDATYKWELWNKNHVGEFEVSGTLIGKPSVIMYPKYYRDIPNDYETGIFATNFPQNPWVGDAWQLYWAQHGESYKTAQALGGVRDALGVFVPMNQKSINFADVYRQEGTYDNGMINFDKNYKAGGLTGKVNIPGLSNVNSFLDLAQRTASVIAFKKDLQHMPNQAYGQANADILNMMLDAKKFVMYQMTIKSQFAKIIDQYFSRFGYACHQIKVPNRNARLKWTYTKTIGCEISGNVPSDEINKIKSIYNHGITFWNNGNQIGVYNDYTYGAFYNPVYS